MIWTADLFSRVSAFVESNHPGCLSCVLLIRGGEPVPTSIPIHLALGANGVLDRDKLFADLGEFSLIIRPRATRAALVLHILGEDDPIILRVPLPAEAGASAFPSR